MPKDEPSGKEKLKILNIKIVVGQGFFNSIPNFHRRFVLNAFKINYNAFSTRDGII